MKISIIGDSYIITSTLTVQDIGLVAKNKPDALKVFDKEGEQKFAVSFNEGKSSVAPFGITFGGKTRCANGFATLTGFIPKGVEGAKAAKDFVADKLGAAGAAYLAQIEAQVPEAVKAVKDARSALLGNITVLDGDDDESRGCETGLADEDGDCDEDSDGEDDADEDSDDEDEDDSDGDDDAG
ncbi:MAG: hypothetical protein FWD58_08805 [Firmicutes bacterium]|nr:hypothetical protein [Bacillota bacterium]